ncbi:MAG: hypothetical protein ACYC5O_14180 [Anaerolineae bacterium]
MAGRSDREGDSGGENRGRRGRRDNSPGGIGPIGDAAWPTRGDLEPDSDAYDDAADRDVAGGQHTEDVGMRNRNRADPATTDYAASISKDVEDEERARGQHHKVQHRSVGGPITSDLAAGQPTSATSGGSRDADLDIGHGRDRTYTEAGDAPQDVGGTGGEPTESSGTLGETEGMGGADEDEDVAQGPSWEQEMRGQAPDEGDNRPDLSADTGDQGDADITVSRSQGRAGGLADAGQERSAGQMSRHYGPGGVTEEDLDEQESRRPGAHRGRGPDTGAGH